MHSERGFVRFMTTMLSYGFFGNIIKQSDRWRFFGPLRYKVAGFCQFVLNTSYPTQLIIRQVPVNDVHLHPVGNSAKQQELSSRGDGKEFIGNKRIESKASPKEIKIEDQYKTINCLNMPCRCEKSKYGMSPSVNLGIFSIFFS